MNVMLKQRAISSKDTLSCTSTEDNRQKHLKPLRLTATFLESGSGSIFEFGKKIS